MDLGEGGLHLKRRLPSTFCLLDSLSIILLQDNKLDGTIPSNISNLQNLTFLELSDNLLEGPIPVELFLIRNLERVWLSRNNLDGEIPSIPANITTRLGVLDISQNHLDGRIPSSISNLQAMRFLQLSENFLRGTIPSSLVQVAALSTMTRIFSLSHNLLEGELPSSCFTAAVQELKQLNLSFNQFSGSLPHGGIFDALTFDSLKGNKFCETEGYLNCSSRTSSIAHRKEFILLLSITASVLFTLIIFCTVATKPFRGTALGLSRYPFELISDHPRITYRELWEATGGFDQTRLIGSGGFGHVYKGTLRDGSFIAIKVLHQHDHNSSRIFNRECRVLKRVRHRNLMSIITTCSNPEFKAIVLTFMSRGSLEDYLHPRGDSETFLSLTEIVNICSDIAEGMTYLHSHALVQVIHCDLKPSNILLDDDMTAIVSDFDIARLAYAPADRSATVDSISTSTDTFLHGSVGYVAPEYGYGRQASAKGDVYSYGVIVLEMVTRKRPTDEMFERGVSLISWVKY
ncbi:putative leucine-rich repeat receptor-like serine/threonine-protein kinase At2g24130 [Zingiber officinale]|uniref:putative leucine-rich repeat receptor-like serine/threonine-protein kinase At2g24130 n=1 Tax=Zingiber officinale TaxID=94328 RepID=UPI001C4C802E|nr:putative leucine-rich repeat receptor-like serine/threonine-protein kinase At2g24130 [Zingiber officinale]